MLDNMFKIQDIKKITKKGGGSSDLTRYQVLALRQQDDYEKTVKGKKGKSHSDDLVPIILEIKREVSPSVAVFGHSTIDFHDRIFMALTYNLGKVSRISKYYKTLSRNVENGQTENYYIRPRFKDNKGIDITIDMSQSDKCYRPPIPAPS
jgi:hypothetical protein